MSNKIKIVAISILTSLLVFIICIILSVGSNREWIQERAVEKWQKQGFEVVDYEGYQWGLCFPFSSYGGASVWHRLEKIPNNGITYSGFIRRWGNEIHVYGPTAADAIKP